MYMEVLFTQDEYNAVMESLHSAIRACYEAPEADAEIMETYKKNLLSAKAVMLSAWATSEIP